MTVKNLKKSNGFAASDALIAVLIIALFTGIIATIIYNIYLSNSSIKRMGTATGYITKIFENLDKRYYDDTTVEGLATYFNESGTQFNTDKNQINISSNNENETAITIGISDSEQYKINIYIENYNKTDEAIQNGNTLDLVKKLTVTVGYKLGNKNQEITMNRVKSREKLVAPNKPDIALLKEQTVNPIKNINGKWKVCDERDSTWYDYENGYWAIAVITEKSQKLELNSEINIEDYKTDSNIYVWIPRFAYTDSSIEFLYSNTNNYIDDSGEYNILSELDNTFTVPEFGNDSIGIWVNINSGDAYEKLNSVYRNKMEQEIW